MTPRERVLAAFAFQETDIVPYNIAYEAGVAERLKQHYGDENWASRIQNHIARFGLAPGKDIDLDGERYRDPFGAVWRKGSIFHHVEVALPEPCLKGFKWPDEFERTDLSPLREQIMGQKEKFTCCGIGFGLFERTWALRGFENAMMDAIEHPRFYEELLDGILDYQMRMVKRLLTLPLDGIMFSDDWGDQRGVILGPDRWRRFIKPRVTKLYGMVKEAGKFTLLHCCGRIMEILPDILEINLDCLESLQPEANDVYEIKRRTYGRLRLWGGLGTQLLLPRGTPTQVREETLRLIRELGRGGGYILSSAKPIRDDVPTENAVAFIETAIHQNKEKQKER